MVEYVYYKNSLPLKLLSINYLQGCTELEVIIGDNVCNFVGLALKGLTYSHGLQQLINIFLIINTF